MSDTKKSHEVLAEKRLETEQAFPPYKPHEVKKGAVLPGQVYEKYESMEPKDFEEWMKAAPDMDDHPYAHFFDPKEWVEFKEKQRVKDPEHWEKYYKNDPRRTQLTREEWLGHEGRNTWKTWADFEPLRPKYHHMEYLEARKLEARKLKEREIPDPSKLLS